MTSATSAKSPQELINQFWEKTVSHSTNANVNTTLPQSIFAQGFQDQVPSNPGVAENVMAGYNRAVAKCIAKVEKISQECRHVNQKYTDPSFNLLDHNYCMRPLSAYSPAEKGPERENPVDFPSTTPIVTLCIDGRPPISLTHFLTPEGQQSMEAVENPSFIGPQSVKRVRQIFDKPEFFVDGATADDIRQGDAGDCWFLSSLSALCCMEAKELGNLVERVCVKRDEAAGVYGFVFFRDGEWRSEIIDDKLYLTAPDYKNMGPSPEMNYLLTYIKEKDRAEQYRKTIQSNSEALFYARSAHKSETWVPLIEKAYAKAHGDFDALEDGHIADGIEDLTGGLSTFFVTEDIVDLDKFWDEGLALVNQSFLWGCSTSKVNEKDKRGLASRHAYSILEAQTIPGKVRLLKVRNPWGEMEWEGDWSDRSKNWTDELKKRLKHEDKDDGIFWITYEDLLRNYPFLHRTRIFDVSWTVAQCWTNFTVPLLSSDTYEKTFKITLTKAATTAIVLSQLDGRYFRGLQGRYDYGLSFRLHRLNEDDYLFRCHNRHFDDRSINLEVDLEAGVYEVRLKITSKWFPQRYKTEEVVTVNWEENREKLLQICRSYDLAHAKVVSPKMEIKDVELAANLKEPDLGQTSDVTDSEAKMDRARATKVEESKSEDKLVESVKPASADGVESDLNRAPKEKPDALQAKAEAETKTNPNTSEANVLSLSAIAGKSESAVESIQPDHKSDSNTASIVPEMMENSELKHNSDSGKVDIDTTNGVRSSPPKPDDVTAQPETPADQPTHVEPPTRPPSSSFSEAGTDKGSPTDAESSSPAHSQVDNNPITTISDRQTQQVFQPANTRYPNLQPHKHEHEHEHEHEHDREHDREHEHDHDYGHDHTPPRHPTRERAKHEKEDAQSDESFTSICTVGLRVYCKNAEARIELIRPSTALVQHKQFTSSREREMDVDDPAKS